MTVSQSTTVTTSPVEEGNTVTVRTMFSTNTGEFVTGKYLSVAMQIIDTGLAAGNGAVDADISVRFGASFNGGVTISWVSTQLIGASPCYIEATLGNSWLNAADYYLEAVITTGTPGSHTVRSSCIERTSAMPSTYEQDPLWDGPPLATRTTGDVEVVVTAAPGPDPVPPVASFTIDPTSGAASLAVDADATASTDPDGSIVSYDWDWGDGDTDLDAGPTLSHTYTVAGTYTITLTVTDDDDLTDTATFEIEVLEVELEPPTAVITASNLSLLPGQTATFYGTDSYDLDGSIVSYDWMIEQPSPATPIPANTSSVSASFSEAGSYTVTLTVTDNDGLTDTDTVEVIVGYAVVTDAIASQPILIRKT